MKLKHFLVVVVLMLFSGWTGMLIGEKKLEIAVNNWKPAVVLNKTPVTGFESLINGVSGLRSNLNGKASGVSEIDFSLFWTVWEKMNSDYVDKSLLDPKKMVDGAISGMVASVGDPYTVYLPVQQNKEAKEDLGGAFEGVGIQLGFKDQRLSVMTPLDGSPAQKAGVLAGDLILRIQDKELAIDKATDGISLPEAVKLIRGKGGTRVVLTFARAGVAEPFETELVRDTIVVKSATVEFVENGKGRKVAWLKLSRFGDRTQEEWLNIVQQISNTAKTEKFAGVVLDLRNNPGGYLEGAVFTASEFLGSGKVVVTQQYGTGKKIENKVIRNGSLLKMPLVVIVNKGSASASEILAGALQDYGRAKILGVQSFGKGSVQQPDDFPDGSGVHITVAKWLRPSGEWLDKKGVTPDMEVKWENIKDYDGNWKNDSQLMKAIEEL